MELSVLLCQTKVLCWNLELQELMCYHIPTDAPYKIFTEKKGYQHSGYVPYRPSLTRLDQPATVTLSPGKEEEDEKGLQMAQDQASQESMSKDDSLAVKVSLLEAAVNHGDNVPEEDFVIFNEQLLNLDGIKADQVNRVQKLVDTVANFKARNANTISNDKAVSVPAKLEKVEGGMGSLSSPSPEPPSSSQSSQDREQ